MEQEIPDLHHCKLQAQESQWCSPSPNPKLWEAGVLVESVPARIWKLGNKECWCPRAGEDGYLSSIQTLKDQVMPPLLLRPIFFPHLLTQMLMSFQNTLIGTPRNDVLAAVWGSISPMKLGLININNYAKTSCGTFQHQNTGVQKIKLILTNQYQKTHRVTQ